MGGVPCTECCSHKRNPRLPFGQMVTVRFHSETEDRVRQGDAQAVWLSIRLLTRVEAMGLVDRAAPFRLSEAALADALVALAGAGIARSQVQEFLQGRGGSELLCAIDEAVAISPVPDTEWVAMAEVLGDDLLARMVGAAPSSVGRYRRGQRSTPDSVADRLHFLTLMAADLAGSYNARGVRRWFSRSRPQLDGRSPVELLAGSWDPDDPGPQRCAVLAGALTGSAGAT